MQTYTDNVVDRAGNTLSGAQVTVYLADGTTKATLPANPIVTGADGEFSFALPDGKYVVSVSHPLIATKTEPVYLFDSTTSLIPTADEKAGIAGISAADPAVQSSEAVHNVATIAALRLLPVVAGKAVQPLGYYAAGDGGGGPVRVGKTGTPGTYVDNGGSIIVPTGGDGSAAWVWEWSGGVNVRWFGAKGDGIADDTATIEAAARFAASSARSITYSSFAAQSSVTLDFPPSLYYLGSQVDIDNSTLNFNVRCIGGRATFVGASPAVNKGFVFEQARNIVFENLNFIGFTTATEWDTNNVDSSLIRYIDCEFINCGIGVDTVSYAASRSTVLEFIRCRAGGTSLLVKTYCDMTIIDGGSFRNADGSGAFIYADSQLIINDSIFTPYASGATARWIDITNAQSTVWGRPSISLNRVRFGTEQSGGIPVAYSWLDGNTAQGSRSTVTHISVNDSYIGSNNTATPRGVIVLMDNGVSATLAPNIISVRGGSWNANNGFVVTESANPIGLLVGQFVIDIDKAAQGRLGSASTAPSTLLVAESLEKYVVEWNIGLHSVTATGSITYAIGGKRVLRMASASAATLTDLTDALDGHTVTLVFANGNTTVKDLSTGGNFNLAGGADFTGSTDATLTLVYSRADADWHEISRSVN